MVIDWIKKIQIILQGNYKKEINSEKCIKNTEKVEEYPSSEIMLEIIREEYKNEVDRGRSFDSRAGIFLPIIGAVIVFLPELVKEIKFKGKIGNIYEMFPYVSILILIIAALYYLINSLNCFIKVLQSKEYKTINYNEFTEENSLYDKSLFSLAVVEKYREILDVNIPINDGKAELYKRGIIMMRNSIFTIIIIILLNIFIGLK